MATCVFVVVAFRATWPIAKSAARVLMETAPEGLDVDALRRALEGLGSSGTTDGGLVVRDLHVWSVSMPGGGAVGSVRATVRGRLDAEEHRRLVRRAEAVFAAAGVAHATVQIEGDACVDGGDAWRAGERAMEGVGIVTRVCCTRRAALPSRGVSSLTDTIVHPLNVDALFQPLKNRQRIASPPPLAVNRCSRPGTPPRPSRAPPSSSTSPYRTARRTASRCVSFAGYPTRPDPRPSTSGDT